MLFLFFSMYWECGLLCTSFPVLFAIPLFNFTSVPSTTTKRWCNVHHHAFSREFPIMNQKLDHTNPFTSRSRARVHGYEHKTIWTWHWIQFAEENNNNNLAQSGSAIFFCCCEIKGEENAPGESNNNKREWECVNNLLEGGLRRWLFASTHFRCV